MRKFSCIIFDYDGTLIDSYQAHLKAMKRLLSDLGIMISDKEVMRRFGKPTTSILSDLLPPKFHKDLEDLALRKQRYFLELLDELRLYPDVKEVLRELKEGSISIGLASSMNRLGLERSLEAMGIKEYFDAIISAEDVKHGKPSPDIFLKAAEILGKMPGECLVVGDSIYDVMAARDAKMEVVTVGNNPYQIEEIRKRSAKIVKNLRDILDLKLR